MKIEDAMKEYSSNIKRLENFQEAMRYRIENAIPDDVKQAIDFIHAELDPKIHDLLDEISGQEAMIKEYVLTVGYTVKGDHHMAVYSKGRTSWDTKSLEGYAKAHPELLVFKSEGKPSVSIRKAGK